MSNKKVVISCMCCCRPHTDISHPWHFCADCAAAYNALSVEAKMAAAPFYWQACAAVQDANKLRKATEASIALSEKINESAQASIRLSETVHHALRALEAAVGYHEHKNGGRDDRYPPGVGGN